MNGLFEEVAFFSAFGHCLDLGSDSSWSYLQPGIVVGAVSYFPLSSVPFWLVYGFFIYHIRRVVLLVILVGLVLGRLHKFHMCIGLHRRVLC